jgi:hypothetical protein
VSLLLPRPGRRAGENRLLLFRHWRNGPVSRIVIFFFSNQLNR